MKSTRILLAITLTSSIGVALWLLLRPGTEEETAGQKQNPVQRFATQPGPGISAHPSDKAKVPKFGTEEFRQFTLERAKPWLKSRHRDAASLVAVWDLTGDESLLDEAAEKFPNDPRVCTAMINRLLGNKGDAMPWVDRLMAAEPQNPAGKYWKAQLLAKTGKSREMFDMLKAAVATNGPPNNHLRDRMMTVREAALASGFGIKDAAAAAFAIPVARNAYLPPFGGSIGKVLHEELIAAKSAGNEERIAEIASLGAASAEHLALNQAPSVWDDLVRMTYLRSMLSELPPDTEFGSRGKTVADRLNEVNAERERFLTISKSHKNSEASRIGNLTESQASEYLDRILLNGEWSATCWLFSQLDQTPADPPAPESP